MKDANTCNQYTLLEFGTGSPAVTVSQCHSVPTRPNPFHFQIRIIHTKTKGGLEIKTGLKLEIELDWDKDLLQLQLSQNVSSLELPNLTQKKCRVRSRTRSRVDLSLPDICLTLFKQGVQTHSSRYEMRNSNHMDQEKSLMHL